MDVTQATKCMLMFGIQIAIEFAVPCHDVFVLNVRSVLQTQEVEISFQYILQFPLKIRHRGNSRCLTSLNSM